MEESLLDGSKLKALLAAWWIFRLKVWFCGEPHNFKWAFVSCRSSHFDRIMSCGAIFSMNTQMFLHSCKLFRYMRMASKFEQPGKLAAQVNSVILHLFKFCDSTGFTFDMLYQSRNQLESALAL